MRIDSRDARTLAVAIRAALYNSSLREREVSVGASLARRALEPRNIAYAWLEVYLEGLSSRRAETRHDVSEEAPSFPIQTVRSRLSLTAVSARELYATWKVRPEDWLTALEWVGQDGARATLVLRLYDVSDIKFHGDNAHGFRDVELGPEERNRLVGLDAPGRSIAASLGVRTPRGFFLPLAHARICHLAREGLAPSEPSNRGIGVPRRS